MVICPKCGQENPDGSKFCSNCGTNLIGAETKSPSSRYLRTRSYEWRNRRQLFWPFLIGFFLIIWGLSQILEIYYRISIPWWPIILVAIGVYLIIRALMHRS